MITAAFKAHMRVGAHKAECQNLLTNIDCNNIACVLNLKQDHPVGYLHFGLVLISVP